MNTQDMIEKLEDLCQLDHDAVGAYTRAIEKIDVMAIRTQLERFRTDHERHIHDLNGAIERLGGRAVEPKRDVKGVLIEGMTMLRSATGTKGALAAMKSNEHLTNKTYQKALDLDLPFDVHAIVRKNRDDEALHLAYIERALEAVEHDRLDQLTGLEPGVPPGS